MADRDSARQESTTGRFLKKRFGASGSRGKQDRHRTFMPDTRYEITQNDGGRLSTETFLAQFDTFPSAVCSIVLSGGSSEQDSSG